MRKGFVRHGNYKKGENMEAQQSIPEIKNPDTQTLSLSLALTLTQLPKIQVKIIRNREA